MARDLLNGLGPIVAARVGDGRNGGCGGGCPDIAVGSRLGRVYGAVTVSWSMKPEWLLTRSGPVEVVGNGGLARCVSSRRGLPIYGLGNLCKRAVLEKRESEERGAAREWSGRMSGNEVVCNGPKARWSWVGGGVTGSQDPLHSSSAARCPASAYNPGTGQRRFSTSHARFWE